MNKASSWAMLPGYLLFFLMLFVPAAYQPIKGVLVLVVLGYILVPVLWTRRFDLHPYIGLVTLSMVATGMVFVTYGALRSNPGALRVGTVYVLWPVVYTIFAAGVARPERIYGLVRVLVAATIAVALYNLDYLLHEAGLIPGFLYFELDQGQHVGFYTGFTQISLRSTTTLIFVVPFLFAALMVWPKEVNPPVSRRWLWIAFVLGYIVVLLTGRRALWFVVAIAPFITMLFRSFLRTEEKRVTYAATKRIFTGIMATLFAFFFIAQFLLHFDFTNAVQHVQEGFEFSNQALDSPYQRQRQYYALIADWSLHPWIGMGHGAVTRWCVRSEEQPWAYELSYLALLFHTGLIGFTIYTCGILWIFWSGFRLMRSGSSLSLILLPLLSAMACFLIANATNPYLETYDHLWTIFLPLAVINVGMIDMERARARALPTGDFGSAS